jgi:hypothetical protein
MKTLQTFKAIVVNREVWYLKRCIAEDARDVGEGPLALKDVRPF